MGILNYKAKPIKMFNKLITFTALIAAASAFDSCENVECPDQFGYKYTCAAYDSCKGNSGIECPSGKPTYGCVGESWCNLPTGAGNGDTFKCDDHQIFLEHMEAYIDSGKTHDNKSAPASEQ